MPQIHSAFLSRTDPRSVPDTQDISVRAADDPQVHPVPLVLAGIEGPVRGSPAKRCQGGVEDPVGVPGLLMAVRLLRCYPWRAYAARYGGGMSHFDGSAVWGWDR